MAELTGDHETIYTCKTCGVEFVILDDATAVCCPICRMNRITTRQ
jgi:DNA-directed RNA polymerase subunit RPC12/RpoP